MSIKTASEAGPLMEGGGRNATAPASRSGAPAYRFSLSEAVRVLLQPTGLAAATDFAEPPGEPALLPADSVSWRVFSNPLTLFVGGVAAVILQLAEPRVRGGWDHSRFRSDPVGRLGRTAHAAMISVYGPRSATGKLTVAVRRRHESVRGVTPAGRAYYANDPELLNWVQATVSFGMAEAHRRYVGPLSKEECDRFHAEGAIVGAAFGAVGAPSSVAEREAHFQAMSDRLEATEAIFELLAVLHRAPLLPVVYRPAQALMIRGSIELIPGWLRCRLGLGRRHGLPPFGSIALAALGRRAGAVMLAGTPPVEACRRLGLPADYLKR
jgi:uncharacterized protein (DUF2236 family)